MAEESVGTIIDSENKILTPVYIYTDSNSTTLPTTPSSSKAGFGVAGGIYNGNFYGIAVNPEGKVSTITWNRTSDPVIGNTDLVVVNPGTGQNPLASGFNITWQYTTGYTDSDFNILNIDEVGNLTTGDWNPLEVQVATRYYRGSGTYVTYHYNFINLKINNNTSKNLIVQGSLIYKGTQDYVYNFNFNSNEISSLSNYSVTSLKGSATNPSSVASNGGVFDYTLSLNLQVVS